jgi:hypothetical protein
MKILFAVLLGLTLTAQSTRVVELTAADAQLIRKVTADLAKAKADYEAADKYVKHKYAALLGNCMRNGECFEDAAEYSDDLRYILNRGRSVDSLGAEQPH